MEKLELRLLTRLITIYQRYPRQFWLMFFGMLISTIGASMIWPFLMIYASEKLGLPLTQLTLLLTINAAVGLGVSFLAGPLTDRTGRKWIMVVSLAINGLVYVFMSQAETLTAFAVLMAISGAFNPVYRVGSDAMLADLIPPERRADAFSLARMSHNIGISIGPAVGGFIASTSYTIAFYCAAAGLMIYSILLWVFAIETLPKKDPVLTSQKERFGGYGRVFKDAPFMSFAITFVLPNICAVLIWVLLGVYAKQQFQIPESQYGLIATTNALMVVFFQYFVTQITKMFNPLLMIAMGSFFYGIGAGSVALSSGFWGFWLNMVIMTVGELILVPTAFTYAANLAPTEMRGRYMGLFGLSWPIAAGVGPVFGGFLADYLGPSATWYGGLVIGLIATLIFSVMARSQHEAATVENVGIQPALAREHKPEK